MGGDVADVSWHDSAPDDHMLVLDLMSVDRSQHVTKLGGIVVTVASGGRRIDQHVEDFAVCDPFADVTGSTEASLRKKLVHPRLLAVEAPVVERLDVVGEDVNGEYVVLGAIEAQGQ